jgi:hypothetical protein
MSRALVRRIATVSVAAALGTFALAGPAQAASFAVCDKQYTNTAADASVAGWLTGRLQGNLRGALTAERISCARAVVSEIRARGLHRRAAVIAVATAIVESGLRNYATAVDHDSLGLFQQRPSQGWGTPAQLIDPTYATDAFLNAMLRKYPNNAWMSADIGTVCQAVQGSAFPERYGPQAPDAEQIVSAVWAFSPGDVPLSGDFDGDRDDDVAVWRTAEGRFHLATDAGVRHAAWGGPGDIPVAGDWNGDDTDDVGIFRPAEGRFHLATASGVRYVAWGAAGDVPVAGDFDGNGADEVAIWRPNEGRFHIPTPDGVDYVSWGGPGDIPVIGDWNNDGADDVGVWRPWEGRFHLATAGGVVYAAWGGGADLPVIGDFDGNGTDNIGIWRPQEARFHLNLDNGATRYAAWGEPRSR